MIATPLLLLLGLAIVLAATVAQLSSMLLHPPRMSDGRALALLRRLSPSDLGLPFEPMAFDVLDERGGQRLTIAAWWIPAVDLAAPRTCIILHGYGDAKVGGIAWAPLLHELGWHVLAIDLRAHGESGGTACTGGDRESADLAQLIAQLRARLPNQTKTLALFGVSLGGAVALAAAARPDVSVDAVIAESVFSDFVAAALTHARLIGAPARVLHRPAVRFGIWRAGARIDDVRPVDSVARGRCPIMIIHGSADPFVPAEQRDALAAAIAARGNEADVHFIVEGAGHCLPMVAAFDAYRDRVGAFLKSCEAANSSPGSGQDEVVRDR